MNASMNPGPGDGGSSTREEYAVRVSLAVAAILITILGICGNSLVILSVALSKKLQTATNIFVTNLAVADFLTCTVVPWNVVALLSNTWPVAEWVCALAAFTLFLCIGCSVWNLASIAINRLLVITLPASTFQKIFTRRHLVIMVSLTWFIPALVIGIPVLIGLSELGYDEENGTCSDKARGMGGRLYHVAIQAIVLLFIPMIIIIFCYVKVFIHVRAHTQQMIRSSLSSVRNTPVLRQKVKTRNKQQVFRVQTEISKNSFYVVCAFLCCVIPFAVTLAVLQQGQRIASVILLASACINPFVYAIKHPHFKKVFMKILYCKWHEIPGRPEFLRSHMSTDRRMSINSTRRWSNASHIKRPSSSIDDIL